MLCAYGGLQTHSVTLILTAWVLVQLDKDCNPHLTLNIIGPDQSAHRVAFGVTSSTTAEVTCHAVRSVLNFAKHVTKFYGQQGWEV